MMEQFKFFTTDGYVGVTFSFESTLNSANCNKNSLVHRCLISNNSLILVINRVRCIAPEQQRHTRYKWVSRKFCTCDLCVVSIKRKRILKDNTFH